MRKVIYLLATISLVGCTRVEPQYSVIKVQAYSTRVGNLNTVVIRIFHLPQVVVVQGALGVVHDPDCKCRIRKYQH